MTRYNSATQALKQIISQGNCRGILCDDCPLWMITCMCDDPICINCVDDVVLLKATNMMSEMLAEIIEGA